LPEVSQLPVLMKSTAILILALSPTIRWGFLFHSPNGLMKIGQNENCCEIKACADHNNGIVETNETDNCLAITVKVNDPNVFSPCNTVTPQNFFEPAYNAYGAPFDLFRENTMLVDAKCSWGDTHTIHATVGIPGDLTHIIYMKGYYYDPSISNWKPYTATCNGAVNGGWCQGNATATITDPNISTASANAPTYFAGMVCSVQGGQWRCGCRDTTCTNFYWMIQGAGQ
jgi:hypothetical protein